MKEYGDFLVCVDGSNSIVEWGSGIHYDGKHAYMCTGKYGTWEYERWTPNFGDDLRNSILAQKAWEEKAHEAWIALCMDKEQAC